MKTKYIVLAVAVTLGSVWAYEQFDMKDMSTLALSVAGLAYVIVVGFIIRLSGADNEKWE